MSMSRSKFGAVLGVAVVAVTLTACNPAGHPTTQSEAVSSTTVQRAKAAIPDRAALLAAMPLQDEPTFKWALEHGKPYIFLARNGSRTCTTWVLQSDGQMFGFSGHGPYTPGLLSAVRLTDLPQAEWAEKLRCTMKPGWASIPPTPASELPRSDSGLAPGDPVPTKMPSA